MKIVVNLDVMMAKRKMSLSELAQKVDITIANLSILKNNKARAFAFPPWRLFVKHWIASRGICWSLCRTGSRNRKYRR